MIEGNLEVKLPTIWRRGKSRGKSQGRERVSRQKIQMHEKVEKSQNTVFYVFFPIVVWLRRVEM